MPLFDWLRRGGRQADPPTVWSVYREGGDLVAEDGRGGVFRAQLVCARAELPLDELTEKMFSRVGQYSSAKED